MRLDAEAGTRLARDTLIDPAASDVYELLFEGEDESARQVHAPASSASSLYFCPRL